MLKSHSTTNIIPVKVTRGLHVAKPMVSFCPGIHPLCALKDIFSDWKCTPSYYQVPMRISVLNYFDIIPDILNWTCSKQDSTLKTVPPSVLCLSETALHNPIVQPKALLPLMPPPSLLSLLLPIHNVSPGSADSTSKLCHESIHLSPTPLLSFYFPSLPSLTWITAAASPRSFSLYSN